MNPIWKPPMPPTVLTQKGQELLEQAKLEKLQKLFTEQCGFDEYDTKNLINDVLDILDSNSASTTGYQITKPIPPPVTGQSVKEQKYCIHEHSFLKVFKWTTYPRIYSDYQNCPDCGKVLQSSVLGSFCLACKNQDDYKFWKGFCPKCGSPDIIKGKWKNVHFSDYP
jgi:hypothetical protein